MRPSVNLLHFLHKIIHEYESLQANISLLFSNNTENNNRVLLERVNKFELIIDYFYHFTKQYIKKLKEKCISNIDVFKANSKGNVSTQMDGYF